ncbi:hypothetical protein BDZ94DRAFT_1265101 [Collybia nuda]|uniref:NUDE domain-containing protein n=1 Tax=Collybia nuda TaxID=64659 RepID=A0A9P6CCL0_9AGAR|nr:hypothetical protein BDZ94DRAFT_1265101 [Collybia nuda]
MMTAVLTETEAIRQDRHMSLDDNQISYSNGSVDWREKYNEVADMLAETRAELDDFHHASKELEAELENELQRTEKAQQDLRVKVARAESERDDWKNKFMSLQTTHNTTTTFLQRELDELRREHQKTKVELRDLEMGNDDLERNERAVSSSLADMEAKYSRALEEKILLEHELLEKASLEEETQRLKDELRDANVEISILKDQALTQSNVPLKIDTLVPHAPSHFPNISAPSEEDLLNTPPPPDLQLFELSPSSESLPSINTTPKGPLRHGSQAALLHRTGLHHPRFNPVTPPNSSISRSTTLPNLSSPSTSNPRTPTIRPPVSRNVSSMSTTTTTTTSKNKGVQMVSEMRARVRNLEQKIHTRVPRLRMGSITGRPNVNSLALSTIINGSVPSSSSSSSSKGSTAKTSWESLSNRHSVDSRRSKDSEPEAINKDSGDSSGWVLIMEDSPSPPNQKEKDRRRVSSPSAPTAFRPTPSSSIPSPTFGPSKVNTLGQSTISTGLRRPQSRLSASSAASNSLSTPSSRPATPTFLPIPSGNSYAYSSTTVTGLKRSTGPAGPNPYSQTKRSSLGSGTAISPHDGFRDLSHPRPAPGTFSSVSSKDKHDNGKVLPQLPSLHSNSNITMRVSSKLPSSGTSISTLTKSRIGRPSSGGLSGRKSTDLETLNSKTDTRSRSGSTNEKVP